jgi:hypothetical protein
MVLREAFWQAGIGQALGIRAAMGAGYRIARQLFGVTAVGSSPCCQEPRCCLGWPRCGTNDLSQTTGDYSSSKELCINICGILAEFLSD